MESKAKILLEDRPDNAVMLYTFEGWPSRHKVKTRLFYTKAIPYDRKWRMMDFLKAEFKDD